MKPAGPPFTVKILRSFVLVLLIAILATALILHLPWMYMYRTNIQKVVSDLNREIVNSVSQKTGRLFDNTEAAEKIIKSVLENGVVDRNNRSEWESFYVSMLLSSPYFSWVSFGWPNGDFMGAQRDEKEGIRFINSVWEGEEKKATRTIKYYNSEAEGATTVVNSRTVFNHNYFAPQRSWYQAAVASRNGGWTKVYVFDTSQKPGISISTPLLQKGEFVGAISIAIELDNISRFLKNMQIAKTGTAFIINSNGQIVAAQQEDEVATIPDAEINRLKSLQESKHPLFQIAQQALTTNQLQPAQITQLTQFNQLANGENYFVTFAPLANEGWLVCTIMPESDFLQDMDRNNRLIFLLILVFLGVTSLIVIGLAKRLIVNPILQITQQTQFIKNFELERFQKTPSRIQEIDVLSGSMAQLVSGLASFKKYLSTDLVRTLLDQGIEAQLGGEEKSIIMFFSDIASFTKVSEQLGRDLIPHLAEYLGELSEVITQQQGTIDKYIGDAIMAFWNAPVPNKHHAVDACRAALHCQQRLAKLQINWSRDGLPLMYTRIGINTGTVLVGNIGSTQKLNYTVIGDPVNVASRLEALNKAYGTQILIGPQTYHLVKNEVIARKLDTVAVYGKQEGLDIYELLAMQDELCLSDNFDWIAIYEQGLRLYQKGKWAEALNYFMETLQLRREDKPSSILIEKCEAYIRNPPTHWNAITVMDSK